MNRIAIKGWCPSAHRPMQSGDGLIVRIRPCGGRLSAAQALAIADLAARHGNGLIDLTGRGNLQLRGVRVKSHDPLLAELAGLGLVDADADVEAQRNILVTPFWREGDDTQAIAAELEHVLSECRPGLPAKFGFAVDCGPERALALAPADIRFERGAGGGLIVRANGVPYGRSVPSTGAVALALELASWFLSSGGARDGRGRMAGHLRQGARLPDALTGRVSPAGVSPRPSPGVCAPGALVGLAFGQMQGATLKFLAERTAGLRMTPWRMVLVEGLRGMPQRDGLITCADDPLLRAIACTGAPGCERAYAETRALAQALAPHIPPGARLHVSGCAKGCAHPTPSAITLVATNDGFDLVRDGCARDAPTLRGLTPARILADPAAILGGH
ncbi:MAG: precorrin-3B synthase [Bradyrhizobium sp.]